MLFSVLAVSFWVLQVVQHAKFEEMAENNHQRTLALRAPRGVVFDRNGQVLVENRHSYSISIVREHTKDLNHTIRLLAAVLGLGNRRPRDCRPASPRAHVSADHIVQDATMAQVAAVTARRLDFELPDVVVEAGADAAVSGRDGRAPVRIRRRGQRSADVAADDELKSGDIVGQSGIEKVYNTVLMGEDGAKRVVVNSVGPRDPDARRGCSRPKASGCS